MVSIIIIDRLIRTDIRACGGLCMCETGCLWLSGWVAGGGLMFMWEGVPAFRYLVLNNMYSI